jgi:calcineurin-like phosphoesterase
MISVALNHHLEVKFVIIAIETSTRALGVSGATHVALVSEPKQFITVYNFSFDKEKAPEGA